MRNVKSILICFDQNLFSTVNRSLGCTVYQMLTGNIPFKHMSSVIINDNALLYKLELSIPEDFTEGFKHFLKLACEKNNKKETKSKRFDEI